MIGAIDDDQLFRFAEGCVKPSNVSRWHELVAFAMKEKLRLRSGFHRREIEAIHRQRNPEQEWNARVIEARVPRNPRAKGESSGPQRKSLVLRLEVVERRPVVLDFARPAVVRSTAAADAAKIEP